MKEKMLIIGGDLRQASMAKLFSNIYEVYVYALSEVSLNENIHILETLDDLNDDIKYVILPIPAMEDSEFISCPFYDKKVSISEVITKLNKGYILFGGKLSDSLRKRLNDSHIMFYDVLLREELAVLNAVPTAEGTIEIIMRETPVTVFGSKVLIIGGGRISTVLRRYLKALGADVCVASRRYSQKAWARIDNCKSENINALDKIIGDYDVIVNTVPAKILGENILRNIKTNTLLIDLASKPGGVDFNTANELGIKTIWALSIPGKVAPITSGEIVFNTINNIIDEIGGQFG